MRISEAAERAQTERCFDRAKALAAPLRQESRDDDPVPGDSSGDYGKVGDLADGDDEYGEGVNVVREPAGFAPPNGEHGRGGGEEAVLTEPFVAWCVSRNVRPHSGLFVSASMPCRDLDSFADSLGIADAPLLLLSGKKRIEGAKMSHGACFGRRRRLRRVATNRGVNGIDGVMSSAMGYADGLRSSVTLLIGDMATLHDLGSLHALVRGLNDDEGDASDSRITVVCVNNSGGLLCCCYSYEKSETEIVSSYPLSAFCTEPTGQQEATKCYHQLDL